LKKLIALLAGTGVFWGSLLPVLAANTPMQITGWTSGNAEVTVESQWVTDGAGALHIFMEDGDGENAYASQLLSGVGSGNQYRLSGRIYIGTEKTTKKFYLYVGNSREYFHRLITIGEWCDLDYTFTASESDPVLKFELAQNSDLYADNLSLKQVLPDGSFGAELLQNGGFEADCVPTVEVTDLKADIYSGGVELSWRNPEDANRAGIAIYQDDALIEELEPTEEHIVIDGLQNGTSYTFSVRTVNAVGMMSAGVLVDAMPAEKLEVPNVIKDDIGNRIIGLTEEMEFSTDGGESWTKYDGTNAPDLDGDVTVTVRMYTENPGAVAPEQKLFFTKNVQGSSEIELTVSNIVGNEYKLVGKLKKPGAAEVTVVLIREDADRRDFSKILAIGQTESAEDGSFSLTCNLADERNGAENDGIYTVYVDSTVTDEVKLEGHIFVNSDRRAEAAEALWETEDLSTLFETTYENYDAYAVFGFPTADYQSKPAQKSAIMADFEGLMEEAPQGDVDAAIKAFTKALVMNRLEQADKTEAYTLLQSYAEVLAISYGDVALAELLASGADEMAEICFYMAGKSYQQASDLQKEFAKGYALSEMNKATYGNISSIIKEHEDTLGLSGAKYDAFMALKPGSANHTTASKKLVLVKNSTPFTSAEDLLKGIETALKSIQKKESTSGGGGGGGSYPTGKSDSTNPYSVASATTITTETPQPAKPAFSDLDEAAWAEESILALYKEGVIGGYEDGTFRPMREIVREEFAAILVKVFRIPAAQNAVTFADVPTDAWYYQAVSAAAEAGIISGVGNGCFGAGEKITRQDMAAMIYRCMSLTEAEQTEAFADIAQVSDYAKPAVLAMKQLGLINGYPDGSFQPQKTATRAEAVRILHLASKGGE